MYHLLLLNLLYDIHLEQIRSRTLIIIMQGTPNRHYQRGPTVQRYVEAVAVEAVAPASPAIYCPYTPTSFETENTDEEPKCGTMQLKTAFMGAS